MTNKKLIQILAIALGVLMVAFIGVGLWTAQTAKDIMFKNPTDVFQPPTSNLTMPGEEKKEEKTEVKIDLGDGEEQTYEKSAEIVNVLLLGIDSDSEREKQHYGYRSDVMILCSFDMGNNTLKMLSFPRDLYVDVYKMDVKTGEITGTTKNRLNTAYSKGGGPKKFGAENAMKTIETLMSLNGQLDIDVDYYVSLDIDALPKIADAMGGVEVELNSRVSGLGKKGEIITVTSKNIDTYMRDRYTSGGDGSRTERQQRYLIAAAKKMQREGAVKSAVAVYQKIASDIQTNLTLDQITALAGFIQGFNMDELTRHTVATTGMRTSSGASVLKLDEEAFRAYLLENFYLVK